MEAYDLFMLGVLALCMLLGAWKGMAWQVATLASLVVSALVASRCSGPLAPLFSVQAPWNRCLAMLVLYLVTSLVIWLLFRLVAKFIDRVRLNEFDRQVGAMFGLAKGVLWCLVITFFTVTLSENARQRVLRSHSGYYAARLIHSAKPALPPKVRDVLGKYIEQLDEKLDPATPPEGDSPAEFPGEVDPTLGTATLQSDRPVQPAHHVAPPNLLEIDFHGSPPANSATSSSGNAGASGNVQSPLPEVDIRFRTGSEPGEI